MKSLKRALLGWGNALTSPKTQQIQKPKHSASYLNQCSPVVCSWQPELRSPKFDVESSWFKAAARATDALQNSGFLAGGVEQASANILGQGLRLSHKPLTALFRNPKAAAKWSREVEQRWEAWASDAFKVDQNGQNNLHGLAQAALKQFYATGDILATISLSKRNGIFGTRIMLWPSQALESTDDRQLNLLSGVTFHQEGYPIAYRLRVNQNGFEQPVDIAARDKTGLPIVIHLFQPQAQARRGVSPLTPALAVFRQFDQLANATLTAALVQAIFAATVKSEAPSEDILAALNTSSEQAHRPLAPVQATDGEPLSPLEDLIEKKSAFHEHTNLGLGEFGKINHLFPGESLEFHSSKHPNSTYEAFSAMLLREIARALGITYEQLTGNYEKATYSSVRLSTADIWQIVLRNRALIARFYNAVFMAWLSDEITFGRISCPGGVQNFFQNREGFCRADWRGPPKPIADEKKAAESAEILRRMGIISDEELAAERGQDVDDIYAARAREQHARAALGLQDWFTGPMPGAPETAKNSIVNDGNADGETA